MHLTQSKLKKQESLEMVSTLNILILKHSLIEVLQKKYFYYLFELLMKDKKSSVMFHITCK